MEMTATIAQIVIALGILNVWVFRYGRPTPYRAGDARNMEEEFARYGLPNWVRVSVGATKISLAILLLVGLVFAPVTAPAAAMMILLMAAAIMAHIRVGDPLKKSVPALLMLLLSTVVVVS